MLDFKKQDTALFPQLQRALWEKGSDLLKVIPKDLRYRHLQYHLLEKMQLSLPGKSKDIAIDSIPDGYYLLFVNGCYHSGRYPEALQVAPTEKALKNYGVYVENILRKHLDKESNPFCLHNLAASERGLFISVPAKVHIEQPIEVISVYTKDAKYSVPQLIVHAGRQSFMQLVHKSHFMETETPLVVNAVQEIQLEEGARIDCVQYIEKHAQHWIFDHWRVTQKKNSQLDMHTFDQGARGLAQDICIQLTGDKAKASVESLRSVEKKQTSYQTIRTEHIAPNCTSKQHVKLMAHEGGIGNFVGQIYVAKEAQKTDSYQLSQVMLLEEQAKAFTEPQLEIFADDVKASHGSTFSSFSPEELLYLRSRGLSEENAKKLLISGFSEEIINNIPHAQSIQHSLRSQYGVL